MSTNDALESLINGFAIELEAKEEATKRHAARKAGQWTGFENVFDAPPTPAPDRLFVTGGGPLIPSGSVTVFSGGRKSGKTWAAGAWASQEIRADGLVIWVDFERQQGLLRDKMQALGIRAHLAAQLAYTASLPPLEAITEKIREAGRVLVVIDSWRGLQGRVVPGSSANDGDAIEAVYRDYIDHLVAESRPLAGTGAAVVIIDHLTKDGKNGTFGSERKESAADLVITVEQARAFTKTAPGYSVLTWSADRYGNSKPDSVAAYFWHPGDGSQTGASADAYPRFPELRTWCPERPTLAAVGAAPITRDIAVMECVGAHRLKYGGREVAREVANSHPGLFEQTKDPDNAAYNHVKKMIRELKLTKDAAGKIDVPMSPVERELVAQMGSESAA